jgi:hypothetical protein
MKITQTKRNEGTKLKYDTTLLGALISSEGLPPMRINTKGGTDSMTSLRGFKSRHVVA